MWFLCHVQLSIVLLLMLAANHTAAAAAAGDNANSDGLLNLTILHTNDMLSRFEATDTYGNECTDADRAADQCYGGFARLVHSVRKIRSQPTPVLFLNAGNTYVGTSWFAVHRQQIINDFMAVLRPDAACLGDHEFDLGIAGLVPYLHGAPFPLLAANLNLTLVPELQSETGLRRSVVLTVAPNRRVGIIGYLTPATKWLAPPNALGITDEVAAINTESARLRADGVRTIVALGNSGLATDKRIAAECADVDLVVGGHDRTFMWNGLRPSVEWPRTVYPLVVKQPRTGKLVPVVHAYTHTKYLGVLNITVHPNGSLHSYGGQPLLMDAGVPSAPDVLRLLDLYRPAVVALRQPVVGVSAVKLDGSCHTAENNAGNLVTDAMMHAHVLQYDGKRMAEEREMGDVRRWTDGAMAFHNSRGLFPGIAHYGGKAGNISMADLIILLPYDTPFVGVWLSGREIHAMLEHAVTNYTNNCVAGDVLQMSGARVVYNLTAPAGRRLHRAEVLCTECAVPEYVPLNELHEYLIVVTEFMSRGGGGYTMLMNKRCYPHTVDVRTAVKNYISERKHIYPAVEGRIRFIGKPAAAAAVAAEVNDVVSAPSAADKLGVSIAMVWLALAGYARSYC